MTEVVVKRETPDLDQRATVLASVSPRVPDISNAGLLDALFDSAAVGIALLTPETRFIEANQLFSRISGYPADKLRALDWSALIQPDEAKRMRELTEELLAGHREDFLVDQQCCRKDGALIWLRTSMSLIRDLAGKPLRLIATSREVTEEIKVKALVAGQAEALALSVNGASLHDVLDLLVRTAQVHLEIAGRASFFLVDADQKHLHPSAGSMPESYARAVDGFEIGRNSPSCGMAAYTGRPEIVSDVELDPLWAPFLTLAREHGIRACWSFPLCSFDGTVLGTFALYHSSPRAPEPLDLEYISLLSNTAAGLIARHRLEEELRNASAVKDEFISLVSHELRSPVATIYGNVCLLQNKALDLSSEEIRQSLKDIERESLRLNRNIEDLLVLARPENGGPGRDPVDVGAVLRAAVKDHGERFPDRKIGLTKDNRLILSMGSADYLDQVVRNLIGNAEKYSPPTEPIEVHVATMDDTVLVTVRDHGDGVAESEVKEIFEPFFRSASAMEKGVGIGIGLTVCSRLVEAQGGKIWVQTAEGGGAEFCFTLPAYAMPGEE